MESHLQTGKKCDRLDINIHILLGHLFTHLIIVLNECVELYLVQIMTYSHINNKLQINFGIVSLVNMMHKKLSLAIQPWCLPNIGKHPENDHVAPIGIDVGKWYCHKQSAF